MSPRNPGDPDEDDFTSNRYPFNYPADLDRWRALIRVVLPRIKHAPAGRLDVLAGSGSLGHSALLYHQARGNSLGSVGDRRNKRARSA